MSAGLDSLAAVEMRKILQTHFSINLPVTVTFDYPTVKTLAEFIGKQMSKVGEQFVPDVTGQPPTTLQELTASLQSIVTETLGVAVAPDRPLMEAGLDSLGKCCPCHILSSKTKLVPDPVGRYYS